MKINRFIVVVFMIWIFSIAGSFKLYSQALVRDSILIEFDTLPKIHSNVLIDSISDRRQVHPRSLGVSEENKFLFIPIDLMPVTERPVSDEIFKVIECPSAFSDSTRYHISIQYLRLRKITSSKIYPGK